MRRWRIGVWIYSIEWGYNSYHHYYCQLNPIFYNYLYSISVIYSMIKNLRHPELVGLYSAEPFKKKKSTPKPVTDENQGLFAPDQLMTKMILGKNARAHKTFGNSVEPNALPLKPILKKGDAPKAQETQLQRNLQTIEVDQKPQPQSSAQRIRRRQDLEVESLNEKRSRFFSIDNHQIRRVEEKISRKRFLSMIGENYPQTQVEQKLIEPKKNPIQQPKNKQRRLSLRDEAQLPKNYDTVREYLDNNCLNLEPAIKSRLSRQSYLRERKNAKRQSLKFFG